MGAAENYIREPTQDHIDLECMRLGISREEYRIGQRHFLEAALWQQITVPVVNIYHPK